MDNVASTQDIERLLARIGGTGTEQTQSDVSEAEEETKRLSDVLAYCQATYEIVQKLEKKCTAMDNQVTKVLQTRSRSFWRYPSLGCVFRKYNYLLFKRLKIQRLRRRLRENSLCFSQSYSPTSPADKDDTGSSRRNKSPHSDNSQAVFPDYSPESVLRDTQTPMVCTEHFQLHCQPEEDELPSSVTAYYSSFDSGSSTYSYTTASATVNPTSSRREVDLIPIQNPEMRRSALLEAQRNPTPRDYLPNSDTSFPAQSNPVVVKQEYTKSPSTWSVEEVLQYLDSEDPPLAHLVASIFRQHEIDGKALMLLTNETMIKFMGLKIGVSTKVIYYINKLKKINK